jgi:peptide/nickel transport system permease protein
MSAAVEAIEAGATPAGTRDVATISPELGAPPTGPGASSGQGPLAGPGQRGGPGQLGGPLPTFWLWLSRQVPPTVLVASLYLTLLVLAAALPGLLAPHNPLDITTQPPFVHPFGSWRYILGTDQDGRDMLSRVIYGARPSLVMGLGATGMGVAGGTTLGIVAGLTGGFVESLIMRAVDVVLSVPALLLALVVIALLGTGTDDALVAVGIASVPAYARMVRAQTHVVRRTAYVEAATALGARRSSIILQHVVPNAIKPVLVLATLGIGTAIGYGASLSFLGLGTQPPAAEWGSMLANGIQYINNDWVMVLIPGLAITLTVLSVTVLGRNLKRRSEGRARP